MTLTEKDHALLGLLKRNSRQTATALAEQLKVSRPTLQTMMERLEKTVIARYTVELRPAAVRRIRAFVLLNREPRKSVEIVESLRRAPHVKHACMVTGQFDILVELEAADYHELEGVLNHIALMDGVTRTQTCMVLDEADSRLRGAQGA